MHRLSDKPHLCQDLAALTSLRQAKELVCESCRQNGTTWVHLRTCQTCGVTLCCDSSPQQHASHHFRETGHPVVISAEPAERWAWCYVHQQIAAY